MFQRRWKLHEKTPISLSIKSSIQEYAVCPKCRSLYKVSQCILIVGGEEKSRDCDFVRFPRHPHLSRRSSYSTPLMKVIKVSRKSKLVPRKLFLYNSIVSAFQRLINRDGFLSSCEAWRNRPSLPTDTYADIYDARMWKELNYLDGMPYLASPYNYCLLLNVDWFNPFEETLYSAGAIYLVILNLPRSERYKVENMILVGMIPGPHEPKGDINSYLSPLIEELEILYRGVTLNDSKYPSGSITFRAILSCIGSDLPATRKICGFLSHSAKLGCSKCMKEFPGDAFGDKLDYSGYDCSTWTARELEAHRTNAELVRDASSASAQETLARQYGVRYSKLLLLEYFDIIRCHTVDPMHSIFLGIAKHTIKVWKELNIIKKEHFGTLQDRVDAICPPPNIGRIPRKISSRFASFTADEWKQWILTYSLFALNNVLPSRDYRCWLYFVKSCKLLCQSVITRDEVVASHAFLVQFCKTFQELYGAHKCTPNMHMSCHLKDCVLDFGPLPAFWCFSFERYNGMLERTSISWNGPEKQMLTKFLQLQHLRTFQCAGTQESDFVTHLCSKISMFQQQKTYSSVEQTGIDGETILKQCKNHTCPVFEIDTCVLNHRNVPPLIEKVFSDSDVRNLTEMYRFIYPSSSYEIIFFNRLYHEIKQVYVGGELFISKKSRAVYI